MRRARLATLIAGCVLVPGAARAGAEDGAGARLVAICASCHRLDGRNTGIPSILRWEAEEIVDKMHAFRSNERANTVMRAVSLSLSDDEIAAVAGAIERLRKKGAPQ